MAKRKIKMIYGEATVQVSRRIPLSKKVEIEALFDDILVRYQNLKEVEIEISSFVIPADSLREGDVIDVKTSTWKDSDAVKSVNSLQEKKIDPTDEVFKVPAERFGEEQDNTVGVSRLASTNKKVVDMDALRAIASGNGPKTNMFSSKKKPVDEEYDCEYVTNIPDIESQVAIGSKGMAFYDRYDTGIFYAKWEGKYIRFTDEKEFNRFAKDNLIK